MLEKDSDGKPNLISILKHKRKRTDQINDDVEEILEAAGISNSHEFKGQKKISRKVYERVKANSLIVNSL